MTISLPNSGSGLMTKQPETKLREFARENINVVKKMKHPLVGPNGLIFRGFCCWF